MSIYAVTTATAKVAWVRDPSVPAGQPALGSFRCPCGNTIQGVEFAGPGEHTCTCGTVYDGRGWVISR